MRQAASCREHISFQFPYLIPSIHTSKLYGKIQPGYNLKYIYIELESVRKNADRPSPEFVVAVFRHEIRNHIVPRINITAEIDFTKFSFKIFLGE